MSRNPEPLRTAAFDYPLPPDRIARYPAARRDESRLLILDRASGRIEHAVFLDIAERIEPGDVLVVNETRVFPARLAGSRQGGGRAEILLLHPLSGSSLDESEWSAMVRPGARLRPGARIRLRDGFDAEILRVNPDGTRDVRLRADGSIEAAIRAHGKVPLPPYIDREAEPSDVDRYQTVYATATGSVAAPTAGLHFTTDLLDRLATRGVGLARIVLHVGPGTFRPVDVEDPAAHPMHAERYHVPASAAQTIGTARAAGGRVWAVGTTVTRTLEAATTEHGELRIGPGSTDLFIRPGHAFRAIDRLITNFHLPRSTLLMLVAAFAGYDHVMRAYREAIARDYRFYSYGDAMAII